MSTGGTGEYLETWGELGDVGTLGDLGSMRRLGEYREAWKTWGVLGRRALAGRGSGTSLYSRIEF